MRRVILWSILILSLAAVAGSFALRQAQRERSSPPLTLRPAQGERAAQNRLTAPSMAGLGMTDQIGQPFDENLLRGRVWVADFIFTSCAGVCPGMSAKMAGLQAKLPPEALLLSFSVDPKRDTPAVLAEYAGRYGARPGRWFFLTAQTPSLDSDPGLIYRFVQQGFGLSAAEGGTPEEPVIHSSRFVLVDRDGSIRGYYDSSEPGQLERLLRDAAAL